MILDPNLVMAEHRKRAQIIRKSCPQVIVQLAKNFGILACSFVELHHKRSKYATLRPRPNVKHARFLLNKPNQIHPSNFVRNSVLILRDAGRVVFLCQIKETMIATIRYIHTFVSRRAACDSLFAQGIDITLEKDQKAPALHFVPNSGKCFSWNIKYK